MQDQKEWNGVHGITCRRAVNAFTISPQGLRDPNVYILNVLELRFTHFCNQSNLGTHRDNQIEVQK